MEVAIEREGAPNQPVEESQGGGGYLCVHGSCELSMSLISIFIEFCVENRFLLTKQQKSDNAFIYFPS